MGQDGQPAAPALGDAERVARALAAVPWCPPGLATADDSPTARCAALLAWAEAHPGLEADAILDALRPALAAAPRRE